MTFPCTCRTALLGLSIALNPSTRTIKGTIFEENLFWWNEAPKTTLNYVDFCMGKKDYI